MTCDFSLFLCLLLGRHLFLFLALTSRTTELCQTRASQSEWARTRVASPGFKLRVVTRLLPLIVALLVPSGLVENFKTMNPRGGSYLMIRELKGVESMSSRRLLIEPERAMCEGSLPTRATRGRATCPYKVGELEGSECAFSDMAV